MLNRNLSIKKILISLLLIAAFHTAFSQDTSSNKFINKNSVQLDLGGHGLFYSLNYERILINGNRFKTAAQAGISYYPASTGIRDLWMPLGINEIFSFGKHHVELGLGYIVLREALRDEENDPMEWYWSGLMTGRVAYRYQKPGGRLILRASFTPVMEHGTAHDIHPLGGISVGYNF